MRTSGFGFRSMSFTATIIFACFAFSSCSKENIAPSNSAQGTDEVAARKAPPSIIRKKILPIHPIQPITPVNPDVRPGVRDDRGGVLIDYKIDINNNDNSGRESAADEIISDGMGGTGRSFRDNSTIEFQRNPAGRVFHPRKVTPRIEGSKMEVRTKEIITNES